MGWMGLMETRVGEAGGADRENGRGGIPTGSSHFVFVTISTCVSTAPGESELVWHLQERRRPPPSRPRVLEANAKAHRARGAVGGGCLLSCFLRSLRCSPHLDLRSGVSTKSLPFLQDTSTCGPPNAMFSLDLTAVDAVCVLPAFPAVHLSLLRT